MNGHCEAALGEIGGGVAGALGAVDCVASQVTAEAFGRLFAPGGSLGPALTILLTLYVAFFGLSLMLGRSNLSLRALMPRIITIGLVLTFATSWLAFSSVFWNLFIATPDYLATLLTGSEGSATLVFAGKLDVVFQAVQQAGEGQADFAAFSPPGLMWMGAVMLLLGTVGLLVTARIGLALLVALGPIFVVMALFNGTRGLFAGWLKALVMLALAPLLAVLGGSIMLELAVPVLSALSQAPGQIDPQAAMAFFLIGAVHIALMAMVMKVAATMVAGWQVFGFAPSSAMDGETINTAFARAGDARLGERSAARSQQAASSPRQLAATGLAASPANDAGGGSHAIRQTRVFATSHIAGQPGPAAAASRTRGIGSRFRAANTRLSEIAR